VFGTVVHDNVELERVRDAPSGRRHYEQRRERTAKPLKPWLALHLYGIAGRSRAAGKKDHLPPPLGRSRGKTRHDPRLRLVERFPEVVRAADRVPQIALPESGHTKRW